MILFLQSCPSVSVFCDAIATNIFQNLYFLVRNWRITIFSCLFKKTFLDSLLCLNSKRTFYFFIFSIVFYVREPMCRTWHFFAFNLGPESTCLLVSRMKRIKKNTEWKD